jgi:uncharacterized repeat protein (TIGR01451 family)
MRCERRTPRAAAPGTHRPDMRMPRARMPRAGRLRLGEWGRSWVQAVLYLVLMAGAVSAQPGTSAFEVLPAGSLVIPMDNDKQNIGSVFNLAAYGLAVELLHNEIPVKWSIRDTKSKDGIDFSARAARIAPGVEPEAILDFRGGPFVVHAAFADAARSIITAFARDVVVHELTEPAEIPVRYMLLHKPTPWVNTQSSTISSRVLDRAGITRYTVGPDNELAAETCHTIIIEPHNTDLVGLPAIQAFLQAGGNFYAQCASVVAFENGAAATPVPFLTTLGITANNNATPVTYLQPTLPFSQFVGAINSEASGSVRDWSLLAGSAFTSGAQNHLQTTPTIWAASAADLTPGQIGGNIFYLGGHDYGHASTDLGDINAHRMLLNAIMVPAVRLGVCNIAIPVPDLSLQKTGPASLAGPEGTYTLTVSNVGPVPAPDGLMVTDTLPAGLSFVSADGAGWSFEVDPQTGVVVATNPVRLAVGALSSFTITVAPGPALAGTAVTNRAWLAEQSESNVENNVASYTSQVPGATGVVFEDFNQNGIMDAEEIGLPGIRVLITSGGPPVEAVTDENGVWTAVGIPSGPAVVTVIEDDLPAGAFRTAGENPNDFTAVTAGLADGGMVGYAGLLSNLSVTKTGPATAVVSDTVAFVITTTNAGPALARLVVVTDSLPDGMTFISGSRGASVDGQVVSWPSTSIPVGGTLADTVRVRMPSEVGNHVNVAAALGRREDPDLTDNRAEATTFLTRPDLELVKTHTGDFTVGAEGTYLITVANNGDGRAYPPTMVTDTLPEGLTFSGGSGVIGSWNVVADGQVVTATLTSALEPGASASFAITALVGAEAVPSVINTAQVEGQREVNLDNNVAVDSARVLASDLEATKSSDATFTEGVPGTYTITVRNVGDGATTSPVVVRDSLPDGLTFQSGSSVVGAWTFAAVGPVVTATHAATLAPGDSATLNLMVMPGPSAVPSVDNRATVSGGGQVNLANDTTSLVTTPVAGTPDLTVAKTSGALTYGSPGTYTVTVTNVGAAATSGAIIVTDTLPSGLTFLSGNGSDWSFTPSDGNSVVTATYTGAPLSALGGTTELTLLVNVLSTASSVTNTVRVAGGGEINTTNNVASVTTAVTAQPDLAIAKTGPPGMLVGSDAVYTITVTNVGAATTVGTILVADTLPATLQYRGRTNGTFSSTARTDQVVTGTFTGTLAPGASISFTITVRPLADAPPSVTNVAHVSGGSDVNPVNNMASITTPVAAAGDPPDLVVSKGSSAFSYGQQNASYTLAVRNIGGTTTGSNLISVTDTLPAGLSYVGGIGSGWTFSNQVASDGRSVVTATRTTAISPNADGPVITLTVGVGSGADASITNTAWVAGGGETNTANNAGSVTTAIQRGDLTLTKTSQTFSYGANRTYTIQVGNAGPGVSHGLVTVVDTLAAGLSYNSASGTGWTTSAVNVGGRWIVTATSSQVVQPGALFNALTLSVNVTSATSNPVTNTAWVSGGNETNTTNNVASVTTSIAGPDLAVAKSTPLPVFVPGEATSYTLTVSSVGTDRADGSSGSPIMVTDTLPAGIRPTSITLSGFDTSSIDSVSVPGRYIVTANRTSNMNAGVTATVTISAMVTTAAMPSVVNRAWVSGINNGNPANDSASVTTPVMTPDLIISKTAAGTFFVGGEASYRIMVRNVGTLTTFGSITVTDPLPAGLTFMPGSSEGSGWSFSAAGQTVTATYAGPPLAPNDSTVFLLGVAVEEGAAGTVSNTATVAGGGELDTTNNTSTVVTPVGAQPDLTLTKTSGTFTFESTGTYSLQVNNIGTLATSGMISVADTLPAGLTFVPGSGAGSGWTVTATDNVVTATRSDPIAAGASSTFTFEVSIGADAVPSVLNRARVSGGGQLNTTNDVGEVTTPVLRPDLVVDKTAGSLEAGEEAIYTITVTNAGTSVTTEPIIVTDVLPGSLTFERAEGTGWSFEEADQTVTATFPGPLEPGADATFTLTVLVTAPAGTEITNMATVAGGGEIDTGNNTDAVTVTVDGTPDLVIDKALASDLVQEQGGSYALTVTNVGNGSTTAPIVVTDVLPLGLTYVESPAEGWVISAEGQTVTATWSGSLDPGATVGLTLDVEVTAPAGTGLTNVATVAGGGEETTDNNVSPEVTATVRAADLVVTKVASTPLVTGTVATYAISVTNAGDAASAGDIVVTDTIPAGIAFVEGSAQGGGWTFAFVEASNILTATYAGVLVPGQSSGFTLDVDVSASFGVEVMNRAHLAGGSDGNPGNNTATSAETVGGTPVLQVTKAIDPDSGVFQQGFEAGYRITVTNVGQVSTNALITVVDTLAAGVTYVSASGPGWTVTVDGQVVEAVYDNAPILGVGESAQFTLRVAVSALGGTEITNRAHATGGGAPASASDSVTLTVMGRPNLLLNKTALTQVTGLVSPGEDVTYTIVFLNNGSEAAWEVIVTDLLPPEVWFMSGSASAVLPAGIGARLEYSEDDGQGWSEAPPTGACGASAGFSACVTGLRLLLENPLPAGASGSFIFLARVP